MLFFEDTQDVTNEMCQEYEMQNVLDLFLSVVFV